MKTKTGDIEKRRMREARELVRREKQLRARSGQYYMVYLFMVLSLIYIVDEIASTISIQFQSNIINEFFVQNMGMEYGEGLSLFSALGFITYPVTLLIVFYRPLADRFGRKPFLIINTFVMGLGLFLVYLSDNIYVYMIGGSLMGFMVSHDMQCVYILECSNEKNRARNYALIKAVAILGTLLIPLLRETLMQNQSGRWHLVYLVPAILGFLLSFIALLFAKETDTFLVNRVRYLKTPLEEREKQSAQEKNSNAQGGIVNAVKFAFKHRQLRFLMLACCFYYSASLATATYNTVMKESAGMTEEAITMALYLYPVGNALMTFIAGLVSDRFGRKITIIAMSCSAVVCYSLFIAGAMFGFTPLIIGFAIGGFMGSYWGAGDTIGGIMFSESSPTNLRSSVTVINTLLNGIIGGLATIVTIVLLPLIPKEAFGYMYLVLTIPGLVGAIIIIWKYIGETKGLDLKKVTGTEWDKNRRSK
ncbi:MAG: MFS transporter [Lachnospiraceae bacterium]|jgi:MFS family permease|nr:MFS transporter [Lachnospiraceae bacterium]